MTQPSRPRQRQRSRPEATFFYERDAGHAIFPASGMFGGPTPRGEIYIAFFADHAPIPQQVTHEIKDDGHLGDELRRSQSQQGYVRTIGSEIVMSVETAVSLREWLQTKIDDLLTAKAEWEKKRGDDPNRP